MASTPKWQPPQKGRRLYIFLNFLLLAAVYACVAFKGVRSFWMAGAAGAFFFVNGLWSADKRLFSWLHREDPSQSMFRWLWIAFLALGTLLIAAGIVVPLLI